MRLVKGILSLAFVFGTTTLVRAQEEGKGEEGWNKERYIKTNLEWSKKNPAWNPTREELAEQFDQRDVNGDGVLTENERKSKLKKQFVNQRLKWAEKEPYWNPTEEELGQKFDALDTNGDGLLSAEEEAAEKKKN